MMAILTNLFFALIFFGINKNTNKAIARYEDLIVQKILCYLMLNLE
jgi:hypothetical protein